MSNKVLARAKLDRMFEEIMDNSIKTGETSRNLHCIDAVFRGMICSLVEPIVRSTTLTPFSDIQCPLLRGVWNNYQLCRASLSRSCERICRDDCATHDHVRVGLYSAHEDCSNVTFSLLYTISSRIMFRFCAFNENRKPAL